MADGPLTGLVAVVTGATRGLGRETAMHVASLGAAVAVCSRSLDDAQRCASDLRDAHAIGAWASAVDVGSAADMRRFAGEVAARLGPADIVVNNAAVLGPVGSAAEVDVDEFASTLDVNLLGVVNAVAAFDRQLRRSRAGRVVNLSGGGVGGPRPMRRTAAYLVSKAAVVVLTEELAHDFAGSSVTVNAVAPGALPTTFLDPVLAVGAQVAGTELLDDAASRVGKTIEPRQVAAFFELLDYLISPSGAWISGRMLSARWDTPDRLETLRGTISDDLFRLRRIDDDLYTEAAR